MGRENRKKLIEEIEKHRNSKVIVYFVGDRPIIKAQISNDSLRSLYDHLQDLNDNDSVEKIDLYLYSLGGAVVTPWPIISAVREYCKKLNVLIPYKAYSATTLMSLGADKIMMGKKGQLGPIDPQLNIQPRNGDVAISPFPAPVSTEDITSYISFIKEKVGIQDQKALADLTKSLADTLTPTILGQVNRVHSHIRLVAKKMLLLVNPKIGDKKIDNIIESITEKMFIHGHSINRTEAQQIGLHVESMDKKLEKLCWDLFLDYEEEMKINSPAQPIAYFQNENQEEYRERGAVIACIESRKKLHKFSGPLVLKKIRDVPPQLNLNLNIPIQLPPGINAQSMTQANQQEVRLFQQTISNMINSQLSEQMKMLMPVIGINVSVERMSWKEV